jgi:hypothetical protein
MAETLQLGPAFAVQQVPPSLVSHVPPKQPRVLQQSPEAEHVCPAALQPVVSQSPPVQLPPQHSFASLQRVPFFLQVSHV